MVASLHGRFTGSTYCFFLIMIVQPLSSGFKPTDAVPSITTFKCNACGIFELCHACDTCAISLNLNIEVSIKLCEVNMNGKLRCMVGRFLHLSGNAEKTVKYLAMTADIASTTLTLKAPSKSQTIYC